METRIERFRKKQRRQKRQELILEVAFCLTILGFIIVSHWI